MGMTRNRNIRPDFWRLHEVTILPPLARLTLLGLFSYADDHGRENADSALLKGSLWARDRAVTEEHVDEHLLLIADESIITLYTIGRQSYFAFNDWAFWQGRVDRPTASRVPAPPSSSRTPREGLAAGEREASESGRAREGAGESSESEAGSDPREALTGPSPFCSKHPEGTEQPCGPCRTRRLAHERWAAAQLGRVSFEGGDDG